MANAKGLSLRGCFAPVAISGRHFQVVQGNDKTYRPIASAAAVTVHPLAALPPYGCGVPLAGCERPVQGYSTAQGRWCTSTLPDVSLRGAKRRGNLAVPEWITGKPRRKRNCLPEIATAPLGPRNDNPGRLMPLNSPVQGGHYPQGVRRIRKAAEPPTAAQ